MSPLKLALSVCLLGFLVAACDSSSAKFPVRDAGSTDAPKGDGGSIQIKATATHCPVVALTLSPLDAKVGESVRVGAAASTPEVAGMLTYSWTAPSGAFGDSKSSQTTYRCDGSGPQMLTVAVSDGKCNTTETITVYCFGAPGAGATGGAAPGSGGSGAGTGGRGGTGGTGGARAGTGGTTSIGSGGTTSTGTGGRAQTGGASGTGGVTATACSGDPTMDEGQACNQCTVDNCVPTTDGCSLALLGSDAKRQKCLDLYCCIRANNCKDGDPVNCWCGDAPLNGACITMPGAANGLCLAQFQAAAESTVPADIKRRLVDPAYAVGGAVNLAECRLTFCSNYTAAPTADTPTPNTPPPITCHL